MRVGHDYGKGGPTRSDAGLHSATAETALERRYPPKLPPTKVPLDDQAADHIGRDRPLRYLAFGVHEGSSIRRFASIFKHPEATFTRFDSFVGFPERWGQLQRGHFSTGRRRYDHGLFGHRRGRHPVTLAVVACTNPYTRRHILPLGQYVRDMSDLAPPLDRFPSSDRLKAIPALPTPGKPHPSYPTLRVIFVRFLKQPPLR